MKKTNIPSTVDTERLTKRDYQKALRKAKRTKRAAAKANAQKKKEDEPKVYDVLIQFDKRNHNVVIATLEKEKIKPVMMGDMYAWVRNVSEKNKETIANAMSRCSVTHNSKTYKVRVSAMRAKQDILKKTKTESKPTANTAEARLQARIARKKRNKQTHLHHHELAEHRHTRKTGHIVGRKAKLYVADENGNIVRKKHTRGAQWVNLREKKLLERAKKAGKYLMKKEKQAETAAQTKKVAVVNKKAKKPVQTELKLAA